MFGPRFEETQLFDFGYVRLNISCPVAMQLKISCSQQLLTVGSNL